MNKTLNLLFAGVLTLVTSASYGQTAAQLQTATNNSMTMTTTGIQPPPPPNYAQCTGRTDETTCRQAVEKQYQDNLTYYNQVKAQETAAQQQRELASQRMYNGAQQAAADSRDQNKQASGAYGISQMLTQIASTIAMAKFIASCTPTCTNYPALALSIAMALFSQQAGKQKNSHDTAANQACNLSNQVTTTQQNCGAAPGPFNYAGYPNNSSIPADHIIDTAGNCIASADICNQITAGLPPGTSLRDYRKGLDAFANGKAPFKVNPDGSITNLRNGKTYTADDFKDAASMAAAGMSAGDIAMASNLQKGMSGIGSGIDADKALKALNGGGEFEDAAARAAAAAAAAAGTDGLDTNGLGKKDRNVASAEGLAKDFNGELIGVAGDNIWKMMNRRYKLKTAQDSFMNTAKP